MFSWTWINILPPPLTKIKLLPRYQHKFPTISVRSVWTQLWLSWCLLRHKNATLSNGVFSSVWFPGKAQYHAQDGRRLSGLVKQTDSVSRDVCSATQQCQVSCVLCRLLHCCRSARCLFVPFSVCSVGKQRMSSPEISKWRLEFLNENGCTWMEV